MNAEICKWQWKDCEIANIPLTICLIQLVKVTEEKDVHEKNYEYREESRAKFATFTLTWSLVQYIKVVYSSPI